MKNINFIICGLFIALAITTGCSDMMKVHEEFVEDGETIYSVKVDSVFSYPGHNRIRLKGFLKNGFQVKNIIVKWKDLEKIEHKETFPYSYEASPGFFLLELEVAEGQYLFEITSENQQGNSSIPLQADVKVYGDKYKSYLENRAIEKILPNITGGAAITFAQAASNLTDVKLEYQTLSGVKKTLTVPAAQSLLVITDIDINVLAKYGSGYLPAASAIDTIYCAPQELDLRFLADIVFTFDKASWKITGFSSQESAGNEGGINGPAANIIDGNTASYWQSEWSNSTAQLPHYITVDMGRDFNVFSIELLRRSGNTHAKTAVLEGSIDGATWATLGTLEYPNDKTVQEQTLKIEKGVRARYIKVNVTASTAPPYASLAELNISGKL